MNWMKIQQPLCGMTPSKFVDAVTPVIDKSVLAKLPQIPSIKKLLQRRANTRLPEMAKLSQPTDLYDLKVS